MNRPIPSLLLSIVALACSAFGQQSSTAALKLKAASPSADVSSAAAEVLEFERAMEAAVVRGDVAYVDRVSAPDLSFTHGDGWTRGGKPLLTDDRAAFLKRSLRTESLSRNSPGSRSGSSAFTRNVTIIGCTCRTALYTVRHMGRTGNR